LLHEGSTGTREKDVSSPRDIPDLHDAAPRCADRNDWKEVRPWTTSVPGTT